MALSGLFPIVVTPFDQQGQVDWSSLDRLVDHLLAQGADGLGLFGNASEGYALLPEERVAMLKRIRARTPKTPLVVSSGQTGTAPAVALSKEAQDLGADALMVLPPYLLKPDGEGIYQYFAALSDAVSIPIMVQDAPLMTQVAMPAALLARMAKELRNVRSAKVEAPPTAPKIGQLKPLVDDDFAIFGGLNGQFLIEEFQRGAVGTMPSSDITWLYARVWKAMQQGDFQTAWRLFVPALPLIRYQLQPGLGVSAAKHNLVAAGVIQSATVRPPTSAIDRVAMQELTVLRQLVPRDE
jgi:2-keto-3-deoxy-L-arabinonate dehydratase